MLLRILGLVTLVYTTQASNIDNILADLYKIDQMQYLYKLDQMQRLVPESEYYPEADEYTNKLADNWDVAYPDMLETDPAPKEARGYGEAALRDPEFMKQLPISGYQFISGGTGRQEDPPEVKTDKVLPAYCTPPNPCPAGYTGPDNCVKDFENTPDNNRAMLEEQDCPCDAEHMLSCPPGKKTIDPKSGFVNTGDMGGLDMDSLEEMNLSGDPYLNGDMKRMKLVAKKSPIYIQKRDTRQGFDDLYQELINQERLENGNPFLAGLPKRVAAKKQAPRRNMK